MVDKKKRKTLINVILAFGLFTAGNVTRGVFALDYSGEPPTLDMDKSYLQRAYTMEKDLDLYRVALKFDRPVSLNGEVTMLKDGETISHAFDDAKEFASFWFIYFSPKDQVRFRDCMDAVRNFRLTAKSIGGETAEFQK